MNFAKIQLYVSSFLFVLLILTPSIAKGQDEGQKEGQEMGKGIVNNAVKEKEEPHTAPAHPGIVAFREGQWLWSDHLFNLSNEIQVTVEFIKPEDVKLDVSTEDLEKIVEDVFKKAGITPEAAPIDGKPSLPAFHVLIMIYPISQGFTYSVSVRLFEPVLLERVKLDQTVTMQAITWDRSSINIISRKHLKEDLETSVRDLSTAFAERYEFFEKMRQREK